MITFSEAKKASKAIVRNLNPLSVILFGSVAREGQGQDLDFLIVTDESSADKESRDLLLHRCLKKHLRKTAVDSFFITPILWRQYHTEGSPFLNLVAREGRSMYMRNAVQEWLQQAEGELSMARYLLQGGFYKGACYHAQQSVEKSAKAKLIEKGWDLERIHSIERLMALGKDYRIRYPLEETEAIFIDAIYRGRYPAEAGLLPLGEPALADAQKAMQIAEKMLAFSTAKLKTKNSKLRTVKTLKCKT